MENDCFVKFSVDELKQGSYESLIKEKKEEEGFLSLRKDSFQQPVKK